MTNGGSGLSMSCIVKRAVWRRERVWGMHRIARVGREAAAFKPRHVGVSKGVFGETNEHNHTHCIRVGLQVLGISPVPQDAMPFATFEHVLE
jgi:hypothetical protein